MANSANTQDEWTIHALNIHGVFFERSCSTLISGTNGWRVLATSYPVEFPPPNGPWRGKESGLDIWARRDNDPRFVVDALIECKKANPDFVNWILFPKPGCSAPSTISFARVDNENIAGANPPWSSRTSLAHGTTTISIVNDAREVRGEYAKAQGNTKTKTSNAAIQEAAYQVALGTRAIVHEEGVLLGKARLSPEHPAPPWSIKLYIPVIVTTARLFIAQFDSKSVKLSSGEIDLHDAKLEPVQTAVYEYALPKHLQHAPAKPLDMLRTGDSEVFSRMHIFVVHAEALTGFLSDLFNEVGEQKSGD